MLDLCSGGKVENASAGRVGEHGGGGVKVAGQLVYLPGVLIPDAVMVRRLEVVHTRVATTAPWHAFGTLADRSVLKCTRHRCQPARQDGGDSTFRPLRSSEVTRAMHDRPLATELRRSAAQRAQSSVVITSKPGHPWCPSLFTPVVMTTPPHHPSASLIWGEASSQMYL